MKLKDYMRGLGLGIILTTAIFAIANPKEKLTDDQIKERALTLGMELKDDTGLDKALEKLELTITPEPTQAPTVVPTKTPTKEPTKDSDKKKAKKITFKIKKGMYSGSVARLLKRKGIIKDSVKFNRYIVKIGKAEVIRIGKYSISKGASYDKIIDLITK